MLYEFIRTAVSNDSNVCYSIFRQNICIDGISADTYGIAAMDIEKCITVPDVITDESDMFRLLEKAVQDSVSVSGLKDFVSDYVDSL